MDKHEIARALRDIARHTAVEGERSYRARAYRRGAEAIEAVDDFATLLASGRLTELAGVGPSIARLIHELATTGQSRLLERLRRTTPPAVVEMGLVREIGPSKARRIHEELGIADLDELQEAAANGRLQSLRGFGPKTAQRILGGIARHRREGSRALISDTRPLAEELRQWLAQHAAVVRVEVAGPVRRWCETVERIDLVVATHAPSEVRAHLTQHPQLARRHDAAPGETLVGHLARGLALHLHTEVPARFGLAWIIATGSDGHLRELAERAADAGIDLANLVGAEEAQVYAALGLPWLPPEVREGAGELAAVRSGELQPDRLVQYSDIRGMVHCHSIYSDGADTIESMAQETARLGLDYLTITDHSPTAHYAGGVTTEHLPLQWRDIRAVAADTGVDVLRGTESDILADGRLDYPAAIVEQLDIVIASIHNRYGMEAEAMTERLITLMQQPVFKIWGHALARILLHRAPIACDLDAVLHAAASAPVAIEVNGDPRRLDMPPEHVRQARRLGIPFVVSTDAHSTRGMRTLTNAVAMARRGWLHKDEVLNTRSAPDFRAAVKPHQ